MRRITLTEDEYGIVLSALLFSAESEMETIRVYDKIKHSIKIGRYPFPVAFPGMVALKTLTSEQWAQAPASE